MSRFESGRLRRADSQMGTPLDSLRAFNELSLVPLTFLITTESYRITVAQGD